MLCTAKIKLVVDTQQHQALLETMARFNQACNYISKLAFESKTFSKFNVHKLCYYDIRKDFSLSSQMTVRAIGKVCESYKATKKTLHTFKDTGAMVYDQRIMAFKGVDRVSLLTLSGRILVPMIISEYHRGVLAGRRVAGQADLILKNGSFYLLLVIDFPEPPKTTPKDFLGVDLGIKNIAVDSAGETHSGDQMNGLRARHRRLRKKLQSKGTKSAKRLLKKRKRKEARFARNENHRISKQIVAKAKALGYGIALEDLKGIREKTTVRKSQRAQHNAWSFYQLLQFVSYKAVLAGVCVVLVDPRNTSRECCECGHTEKANRKSRDIFCCRACGYVAPADNVAAVNIGRRAVVNQPHAAAA
jgi:IS605 OrfB family transposase